jgi:2-oxoglutarate dehydrogenase E2 component (dihydrolipoamide succinyltransferase)
LISYIVLQIRNKYKDEFLEKHGAKLGFMSAFVKASTQALLKNPEVNAYIQDGNIVYHDFVDVSVAVSTGTGLVVPVLRNTEGMNFAQVESAIAAYGQKARKGQIAMEVRHTSAACTGRTCNEVEP